MIDKMSNRSRPTKISLLSNGVAKQYGTENAEFYLNCVECKYLFVCFFIVCRCGKDGPFSGRIRSTKAGAIRGQILGC